MHVYFIPLQRQARASMLFLLKWRLALLVVSVMTLFQMLQRLLRALRQLRHRLLLRKRRVVAVTWVCFKHLILQEGQKWLNTLEEEWTIPDYPESPGGYKNLPPFQIFWTLQYSDWILWSQNDLYPVIMWDDDSKSFASPSSEELMGIPLDESWS